MSLYHMCQQRWSKRPRRLIPGMRYYVHEVARENSVFTCLSKDDHVHRTIYEHWGLNSILCSRTCSGDVLCPTSIRDILFSAAWATLVKTAFRNWKREFANGVHFVTLHQSNGQAFCNRVVLWHLYHVAFVSCTSKVNEIRKIHDCGICWFKLLWTRISQASHSTVDLCIQIIQWLHANKRKTRQTDL